MIIDIEKFERHLRESNLSENTVSSYLVAVKQYAAEYDKLTQLNLRAYKTGLIERFKPATVNLRLRGINSYLESIGKEKWKLEFVKIQQKPFLENVISEADYEYFKKRLKKDGEIFWYFVIRFIAATGARVSELIQIKVEHVKLGYLDLYSKGGKLRRIYIPKALQNEALSWLKEQNQESGFIFLNKKGERITTRGISGQLKYSQSDMVSARLLYIHIHSGIFLQSVSWQNAMTLPFLPILWGMRALKLPVFICVKQLRNNVKLLTV